MRTNLIKIENKQPIVDGKLDMVIAFDTTGSMSSYIDQVKDHVKGLVPQLMKDNPNMRIGIVAFGDYCDMKSATVFGDAYQVLHPTDNEEDIISFVKNAKSTGGGDSAEFYELVIKKITEETPWREDATKTVLFIADSYPHEVGYSYRKIVKNAQIDWREEARKASEKGIQFDTISIHGSRYESKYEWYEELSHITDGVYSEFKSSQKTSDYIKTVAYARGGEATKALFCATMDSFKNDAEMSAVYNTYAKEVVFKD